MKKTNQQKGFTMIELVVVIVVTGVLAAVAAPKFMGVSSDARISAMNGIGASLTSQASTTHAKSIMEQNEQEATSTLKVKGTDVAMVFGYPKATSAAIKALVDLDSEYEITLGTKALTIAYEGVTTTADCTVIYAEAANKDTAATVTVSTSSC